VIRLQRRLRVDRRRAAGLRLLGVVVSLLLAGVVLQITGSSAIDLAGRAIDTTATKFGIEQTLTIATPILLTALAVALGFRLSVWNIGVEGQLLMGALAAAAVGLHLDGPAVLVLPLTLLAGALGGALWALGPALARAYGNVNEIITTLLLNFVALEIVNWFSIIIWRDASSPGLSATPRIEYELPQIPGTTLTVGVLAPFLIAALLYVVFRSLSWGYEVRMAGGSSRAAGYAGIPVRRRVLSVMCLSGAISGLAGAILLVGTAHRLSGFISNEYGFSGFIVAALAGTIVAVVVVGLLIAALLHAAIALQTYGLSVDTMLAVYGLILLVNGVAEVAARYRIVPARTQPPPPSAAVAATTPVPAPETRPH
jgi:ABC-type uncharacterized transport system permease subunit